MAIIGPMIRRRPTLMSYRFILTAAASSLNSVTFLGLPTTSATMSTSQPSTSNLDEVFRRKKAIRLAVKKELKAMDPTLRSQEDDAIQRVVMESPWFKSCRRLCAYISCGALREADTSILLSEILKNTGEDDRCNAIKTLYVPRVEDKNRHMRMLNISAMDDLIANSMSILEPAPFDAKGNAREDVMLANDPVDLLLLPGLAFDRSGRRLGRGGGYYDTFLTKYQELSDAKKWKRPLLVALSYSCQILENGVIPMIPDDVFVDALVSPLGLIPISPTADEQCSRSRV